MKKDKYARFSPQHIAYLKKQQRSNIAVNAGRIGVLVVVIALWELLAATGAIDSFITSSPSRIAQTLAELVQDGSLFKHAADHIQPPVKIQALPDLFRLLYKRLHDIRHTLPGLLSQDRRNHRHVPPA